jgi:hypothetical protein
VEAVVFWASTRQHVSTDSFVLRPRLGGRFVLPVCFQTSARKTNKNTRKTMLVRIPHLLGIDGRIDAADNVVFMGNHFILS